MQHYLLCLTSYLQDKSKQRLHSKRYCDFNPLVKVSALYFFKDGAWIWLCMLCLILLIFLVQYINWWSEIPTSIIPFWETFSEDLMRMWSSCVEVKHVIRIGFLIISVNENVWQNSLYLFTKTELELLSLYDWFSLRINFPFWSKLILKSPRR